MKDNQFGRSMIEMLGVIAIIGVLTVGGIAGYSKAMEKYRINKTANQISYIATHIRIAYGSQYDYKGLSSKDSYAIIDKVKLFPSEMGAEGNYRNVFAGNVSTYYVGHYSAASQSDEDTGEIVRLGDAQAFMLVYYGIPRSACVGLATMDWGTGSTGGLVALGVNVDVSDVVPGACQKGSVAASGGDSPHSGGAVACEGQGVLTPVEASVGCSSENNNTLYFKFY